MTVEHIINSIESVAPLGMQEEWDNSGLQVGNRNDEVDAVLLTTDVTEDVVSEAIEMGCGMVLSHHPLLYKGLKSITGSTSQERCVMMALSHHIAIYSSHTSMDNYVRGVSGRMAEKLHINDYRLLTHHPHATDGDDTYGLGVIGNLSETMSFGELLERVKNTFGAPMLRYVGGEDLAVQTIAMCGGAGSEFVADAIDQKADVYISADFKYHAMQDAQGKIAIIDMDHWVCEHFTREVFAELLQGKVKCYLSKSDHSPIKYF